MYPVFLKINWPKKINREEKIKSYIGRYSLCY